MACSELISIALDSSNDKQLAVRPGNLRATALSCLHSSNQLQLDFNHEFCHPGREAVITTLVIFEPPRTKYVLTSRSRRQFCVNFSN